MSAEFGKIKRLAAADADDDFGRFGQAESYFGYFFNIDKTHVLFINRFNAVFLQPGIKTVGQKALDSLAPENNGIGKIFIGEIFADFLTLPSPIFKGREY